ncbi:hypothetical protein [Burkholderia sp. PU8-34]
MKSLRTESTSIHLPSVRRSRAAVSGQCVSLRPRTRDTNHLVLLSIQVESCNLAAARRALHQAAGPVLGIYTAEIDNRTGRACLQLELARSHLSRAMSSIMQLLPKAEFGAIRRSRR